MSEDLTSDFNRAHGTPAVEEVAVRPPSLELDPAKYLDDIKEFDLTKEQEREFLETLWSIMRSFVELGFDPKICGALLESFNEAAEPPPDIID